MPIQRITTLLRAVTDVRDWVVQTLPMTSSMVGYDLFLKLGQVFLENRPADLAELYASLRYSPKQVRRQLDRMVEDGLITFIWQEGQHHPQAAVPTERFNQVLGEYRRKFESLFILRQNLREQQLGVAIDDPQMAHFVASLYDRFYDLGWLYTDTYGSMCFVMAMLVERAADAHGFRAEVVPCYADISMPGRQFLLGGQGFAAPGQIEGHAVCVVEDKILIDFGLGNARRGFRRDFPWGLACHFQPEGNVLGGVNLADRGTVIWRNDWQAPNTDEEFRRLIPVADSLFRQYTASFL